MHRAALRGGPAGTPARPGCLLAIAGGVAVAALHSTPGLFPAISLVVEGVLEHLEAAAGLVGRPKAKLGRAAGFAGIILPLLLGLPGVLHAQPQVVLILWVVLYFGAGWLLCVRLLRRTFCLRHGRILSSLLVEQLEEYAAALPVRGCTRDLLRQAAERLAVEGFSQPARRLLQRSGSRATEPESRWRESGASRRRRCRLESALAFLEGEMQEALQIASGVLLEKIDLDEERGFRAWSAYLALAAGRPGQSERLAEGALGPLALADEGWFIHCRSLQAWALLEQGRNAGALELARFVLANTHPDPEARSFLRVVRSHAYLELGESDAARVEMETARREGARPESFLLGMQCRLLALDGDGPGAEQAARRAREEAPHRFAEACALLDCGQARLARKLTSGAAEAFRLALETWPWLPSAELGLAEAARLQGERREERRWRESAARYREHRAARAFPAVNACAPSPSAPRPEA